MPSQQGTGSVFSKLGNKFKNAWNQHKGDEVEIRRFGELPAGINGGVAQVVSVVVKEYEKGDNKGEPFFMAQAICLEPVEFVDAKGNKTRCEGLRTRIGPIPMCDTKDSRGNVTPAEENIAIVIQELKKMGVPTDEMEPEEIEQAIRDLNDERPIIRFDTWASRVTEQYPNPRTNHNWLGLATDYVVGSNGHAVEDNSAPAPAPKPTAKTATNGAGKPPVKAGKGKPVAAPAPEPEPEADEGLSEDQLKEWADAADGGDADAARKLASAAEASGYTQEEYEATASWHDVIPMIQSPKSEEEEETEEEETSSVPSVGEVYTIVVKGKKIGVSVTMVDEDNQTVNVKGTKDKSFTMKKVSWSQLVAE